MKISLDINHKPSWKMTFFTSLICTKNLDLKLCRKVLFFYWLYKKQNYISFLLNAKKNEEE